jgi:hypothetical protein
MLAYDWKAEKSGKNGTGSVLGVYEASEKLFIARKGSGTRSMSPGVLEKGKNIDPRSVPSDADEGRVGPVGLARSYRDGWKPP